MRHDGRTIVWRYIRRYVVAWSYDNTTIVAWSYDDETMVVRSYNYGKMVVQCKFLLLHLTIYFISAHSHFALKMIISLRLTYKLIRQIENSNSSALSSWNCLDQVGAGPGAQLGQRQVVGGRLVAFSFLQEQKSNLKLNAAILVKNSFESIHHVVHR